MKTFRCETKETADSTRSLLQKRQFSHKTLDENFEFFMGFDKVYIFFSRIVAEPLFGNPSPENLV